MPLAALLASCEDDNYMKFDLSNSGIYFTKDTLNYSFSVTPVEVKTHTYNIPVQVMGSVSSEKRPIGYYIDADSSLKTQAMFPMLRESDAEKDYASFIISNNPTSLLKSEDYIIGEQKLIVRTRADSYASISEKKAENALECKAHIVSTDYPPRTDNTDESYVFSFGNRTTVRTVK